MFQRHKGATAIGAVGAVLVVSHVVLGRSVVPVAVVLAGLVLVAGAGLFLWLAGRSEA